MRNTICAVLLTVAIVGCSCQSAQQTPKANPPAAIAANAPLNQWEADAFTVLLDSQAGILKASQQIQDGTLPATLKGDLNRAIAIQNTARQTLNTYDATMRSGGDASSQQAEVVSEIGSLLQLLSTLQQPRPAKADSISPSK